jgi:eukaryotic-like serine/threonine-protein kinase
MRTKLLLPPALGFAVLCAAGIVAAAPGRAATPTHVVVYSPWSSGALAHGFTVSQKAAGSCWSQSLSTDRPNSWRCFLGNEILDPCFSASPHSGDVACPENAFSKSVVVLRLTKPLPRQENPTTKWLQSKGEPWGIRLSNGATCYFVTGATDAVGGDRMNYECRGKTWVVGFPDRSTTPWTARTIAWPNKSSVKKVGIAAAVF